MTLIWRKLEVSLDGFVVSVLFFVVLVFPLVVVYYFLVVFVVVIVVVVVVVVVTHPDISGSGPLLTVTRKRKKVKVLNLHTTL